MADFNLIPCDRLISVLEDRLAGYMANGLLDTGKFYDQINWFNSQMNLAVYEEKDALVVLKDHKGELPCDFYLLDSAWLCHHNHRNIEEGCEFPWKEFQSKAVIYNHRECETINQPCQGLTNGIYINGCTQGDIINKVTIKEYIMGNSWENWNREYHFSPHLLRLGNKVTYQYCSKHCKNYRGGGHDDISIRKQGSTFYLFSNLKNPLIYVKYYASPIDPETKLPLTPDHPILEKALQDYLTFFFFESIWTDSQDVNVENKIKYWAEKSRESMAEAHYLSVLPSYAKMVENAERSRKKYKSFEIINTIHN